MGIAIFIIGAILIAVGYRAATGGTVADRFADNYVGCGSWYVYGGFAGIIVGAGLTLFAKPKEA